MLATLYIDKKDVRLRKKDKRLIVEQEGKVAADIPSFQIDQIVIFGGVDFTIPALSLIFKENIDTIFLTKKGKYKGRICTPNSKLVTLRLKQYERRLDEEFTLSTAKSIVKGKLTNMRNKLVRLNRSQNLDIGYGALRIRNARKSLDSAKTLDAVRGYEGSGTAAYFSVFTEILKYDLGFRKRVRRPPTDPVNSLLSFGYTMLYNDVNTAVNLVGLDPYLGFLHEPQDRKTTLPFDLMEEFRAIIVDSVVISGINKKLFSISDFEKNGKTGGINIDKIAIAKFINQYQNRLHTTVFHKSSNQHTTYKKCIELQVRLMARVIKGDAEEYIPLIPK